MPVKSSSARPIIRTFSGYNRSSIVNVAVAVIGAHKWVRHDEK